MPDLTRNSHVLLEAGPAADPPLSDADLMTLAVGPAEDVALDLPGRFFHPPECLVAAMHQGFFLASETADPLAHILSDPGKRVMARPFTAAHEALMEQATDLLQANPDLTPAGLFQALDAFHKAEAEDFVLYAGPENYGWGEAWEFGLACGMALLRRIVQTSGPICF